MIVAGLDTETTGLKQEEGHRIVEICIQLWKLEEQARVFTYTQRINPQRGIDVEATATHGIKSEDLFNEPVWEAVAPTVAKLLAKVPLVIAHNGQGFDLPFVIRELIRVGQPVPEVRVVDTQLQGRWATPDGKYPTLDELCFATDVEYDITMAHAADYDVTVMMRAFFKALAAGFMTTSVAPFNLAEQLKLKEAA